MPESGPPLLAPGPEPARDQTPARMTGAAQVWFVSPNGKDDNSCTTAAAACAGITAAIIKAADGDTVRVATGTYQSAGNEVAVVYRDVTLSGGWNAGFTRQQGDSVLDGQAARWGLVVKSTANATIERFAIENGSPGGLRNYGRLVMLNSAVHDSTGIAGIVNRLGTLTVRNSSITGSQGSGIQNQATLYLDNSTLSGNRGTFVPAAIDTCAGLVAISNSTIADNLARDNFAEEWYAINVQSSTVTLRSSILAGNSPIAEWSRVNSAGYNLLGEVDAPAGIVTLQPSDRIVPDAGLAGLAGQGTEPRYHPLLPGSPAIDAGNPAGCVDSDGQPLAYDQRGAPRPFDGNGDGSALCDIGAYESGSTPPPTLESHSLWLPLIVR